MSPDSKPARYSKRGGVVVMASFPRGVLETSDMEWIVCALVQERRFAEALAWLDNPALSPEASPNYHLLRANALNPLTSSPY